MTAQKTGHTLVKRNGAPSWVLSYLAIGWVGYFEGAKILEVIDFNIMIAYLSMPTS